MVKFIEIKFSDEDRARLDKLTNILEKKNEGDEVLVSNTEAARLLKRTTPTISVMIRDGRLHRVTMGGSHGIPLSEVKQYITR